MQEYRRTIKDHFERQPGLGDLLASDIIFYGLGLLFLFFYEFSIIRVNSDVFFALGVWFFWFGILLSFLKCNDVNLSVGLGIYAVIYFVKFIIACVDSAKGYGFYGFLPLSNLIVSAFLLLLTVRSSEYFHNYLEQRKADLQWQPQAPAAPVQQSTPKEQTLEPGTFRCPKCGRSVKQGAKFCSYCGYKTSEVKRCGQCGSPLQEGMSFCLVCGANVESESGDSQPEAVRPPAPAPEVESVADTPAVAIKVNTIEPEPVVTVKKICPSCGAEIVGNKKFCTKCGTKL